MRLLKFDQTMKKGMLAGAALGVLSAVMIGVGSSMGAEAENVSGQETGAEKLAASQTVGSREINQELSFGWRQDIDGYTRYYGQDGIVLTNTVTPDGQYVDDTGVWIPDQYDVSQFTSIPSDAKSLMVIEGHKTAARATFYVKEEIPEEENVQPADPNVLLLGPGAEPQTPSEPRQTYRWKKITDTGGYVGKNGIGKVQEGDEKTPRGLYTLDEAFGTLPGLEDFKVPYLQVDEGYYWVGDSSSPYYNTMVDIRRTGEVFSKGQSEHLSTYGGKAYNYCIAVGYNKEQTPHKGSAIFLHCIGGPGTGGCIAIPEEAMVTVLKNMEQPGYILIDDGENLKNY